MRPAERTTEVSEPSWLRQLLFTPLRDLIHGRVTGSGNWRHQLMDAGLPQVITEAIRSFVGARRWSGRLQHAVSALEWAKAKATAGQEDESIAHAIQMSLAAPDLCDWTALWEQPMPERLLLRVSDLVNRSKALGSKRRAVATALIQRVQARLSDGHAVE